MSNPSDISSTPSVPRRAVLGAVFASGAAGCLGYLDDGPTCTLSRDDFETDVVSTASFSHTNSNVRNDGSCDRSTRTRCLEVALRLDPAAVDAVEARTPDGDVVARRTVDDDELGFELAVLERGDSAAFEVVLVDGGTTVDSATVAVDC